MKEKILIIGGFGYIGGRIAAEIVRSTDYQVLLASRESHSTVSWLPGAHSVILDVLDKSSFRNIFQGVKGIVHLAALNEIESADDPEMAIMVNTLGTQRVLQAAINAGVQRFIFFSTAHVYGAPLQGYITEKITPRPVHPYAITHHAAEEFVLAAHDAKKIVGIVVRLSNGFGAPSYPGINRWTLLVNDVCRQVAETRHITMRSSGMQQRDFITLHDVGRAVCHILSLPAELCSDGLFNLGGNRSMTVWAMVQLIVNRCNAIFGFMPSIHRPEPLQGDLSHDLHFSIAKLFNSGFHLEGDVDKEIDDTLNLCYQTFGKKNDA